MLTSSLGVVFSTRTSIIVHQCCRSFHRQATNGSVDENGSKIITRYSARHKKHSNNNYSDVDTRRPQPPVRFARESNVSPLRHTDSAVSSISSESYIKEIVAKSEVRNKQTEEFRHKFIKASSVELKRYLQREQHNRVDAFLYSLHKDQGASSTQQWEIAVAALVHAGGSGVKMTSTLISKVIQLCCEKKQYAIASKLFYQFHFDYQLPRGKRSTLAFLKVCEQTGRYDAASRVVRYIAAQKKMKDDADRVSNDIGFYLDDKTSTDCPKVQPYSLLESLSGVSSLSSDIMTYFLRSVLNSPSDIFFYRKWEEALNLYSNLRNDPLHVSSVESTPELVDSIVGIAERASNWRLAVDMYSKMLKLLDGGERVASAPLAASIIANHRGERILEGNICFPTEVANSTNVVKNTPSPHSAHSLLTPSIINSISYVYDSTIDAVVRACFKAKRHYEVVRTVQTAVNLGKYTVSAAEVNTSNVGSLTATPKSVEKIHYSPDEASARMTMFSVEEVTSQTYERLLGTNLPEMIKDYEVIYLRDAQDIWAKKTALSNEKTPSEYDCQRLCVTKHDLENRKSCWSLASTLFNGLAASGLPLFPQTYESPLRSFVMAGKWELAAKMINEMKQDEREIPRHYMVLVLCEKVAHMNDTKNAKKLMSDFSLFSRKDPAPYIALMRQAMAVGYQGAFVHASKASRENEAVETRQKLLLTAAFEGSPLRKNLLGSISAFSRLTFIEGREFERTEESSNYDVYEDRSIPLPILSLIKGYAEEYVASQCANREKALSGLPIPHTSGITDLSDPKNKMETIGTVVPQQSNPTRCATYVDGDLYSWDRRREENLSMAQAVLDSITKRINQ